MNSEDQHQPIEEVIPSNFTIFELTVDCFDEIFEYLSLKDLHSFGQTCTTMQQVAGQYFKQNYLAAKIVGDSNGICVDPNNKDRNDVGIFRIPISGFESFIHSINIHATGSPFQYIQPYIDQFHSVKDINLKFTALSLIYLKLQRQSTTIQIQTGCTSNDLFNHFLKYCGSLKRLYVQNMDFDTVHLDEFGQRKWLMQKYSNLEHFELIPCDAYILELNSFLERNKKIHTFSTSSECLWKNRHAFLNSKAKLNILEVKCMQEFESEEPTPQSLCNLVDQLYNRAFHRRAHFYVQTVNEEFNVHAVSMDGLEKLCIKGFDGNLPPITGLKELAILDYFRDLDDDSDNGMEILANDLVNLQRLYLCNSTSADDIMPFIRRSRKLRKIKVFLKDESHLGSNNQILELFKLNKEREKLFEARKITIYVTDNIFLATKWATKNGDTNLSLIELKRTDSYEWYQHY